MPITTVTVRGKQFHLGALPPIDVCEDIVMEAWAKSKSPGVPLLRVYAAMVVLCVPEVGFGLGIGGVSEARASLAGFGGEALSKLRERKWTNEDLSELAGQVFPLVREHVFPSEAEVTTAQGKSEAAQG